MAENGSDALGLLSGILANPEALQGLLSTVGRLKESGALDSLLPLLRGSVGSVQSEKEGAAGARETAHLEDPSPSSGDSTSDRREGSGSTLPLLWSLLSGGQQSGGKSGRPEEKSERPDGDPKGRENSEEKKDFGAKESRYGRHRRLLQALKPYLGRERQERIDFLLRLLQWMEIAGQIGLKDLFSQKPRADV